ncbi:peptidoglycan recognition family protein [Morganella morganii]|uniref:peptidoglycan recognition protein family protein n=1 Tax=Morganella morganii TaxID=582 RepID=UPI0030FE01B0
MYIDEDGYVFDDRIERKIFKSIEQEPLDKINGIVVHQTDSPTAQSTFNSYSNKSANGAHFLIDKDGKIYQTASIFKVTWHVGLMQSRCYLKKTCQPTEVRLLSLHKKAFWKKVIAKEISDIEKAKYFPERFLANSDSIGIEIVGLAVKTEGKTDLVYETVNDRQNESLKWLIKELVSEFNVPMSEVYRHPEIGRKNMTEASTAVWE